MFQSLSSEMEMTVHSCVLFKSSYSLFINNCALAGGPSPKILVPVQEYHPASDRDTDVFVYVVVEHPLQLSPEISFPLNCHL